MHMARLHTNWEMKSKEQPVRPLRIAPGARLPEESVPLLFGCAGVYVDLVPAELEDFRAGLRFAGATVIVSALSIFLLGSYFGGF
jgi:hypothetical protein